MTKLRITGIVLAAFLAGILGVGSAVVLKHLWIDHAALHELALIEQMRLQQSRQHPTDDAAGK